MTGNLERQGPNSDQIEFWNGEAARKWVDFNPLLDRMLKPLGDLAMARAAPAPGEHVLDIGCGCGDAILDLAQAVAPDGAVTGLDVSAPMLAKARERAQSAAVPVHIINADAETHGLPRSAFDVIFSRFGVMFFANPKSAFANFHGALKPGGRIAFVCWRAADLNPWVSIPFEAARPLAPEFEPAKDGDPGQFSFADEERVEAILSDAGLIDVRLEPHDTTMRVGDGDVDDCVDLILKLGPVSRLLREADDAVVPAIVDAVRAAVAPYHTGRCIELAAAVWIVSARRP